MLTFSVQAVEFAVAISLVLPRRIRTRIIYPAGIALHLGIIVFMGVSSFSIVMFAALTLLVLPLDVRFPAVRRMHWRAGGKESVADLP